jgi:hypothetical protein
MQALLRAPFEVHASNALHEKARDNQATGSLDSDIPCLRGGVRFCCLLSRSSFLRGGAPQKKKSGLFSG